MCAFNLKLKNPSPVPVVCIGTVKNVIQGHIPKRLCNRPFNAEDYRCGFELATPLGVESLGETVIVNGHCYTRSTDKASPDYYQTISGRQFISSGLFLIPKNTSASYRLDETFSPAMTLSALHQELYKRIKRPYAFAAFIEFDALHCTAIAKAPIHEQNIFEHQSDYYSKAPQVFNNVSAYVVSAAADYHTKNNELTPLLKSMQAVLYKNPFEKQQGLTMHAHGVTLHHALNQESNITPDLVDNTWHIFTEKSQVKSVQGDVFIIGDMTRVE